MSECYICGQQDTIGRRCNECNLPVCTEHRLPENHNCPALLEGSDDEQWFDEKFEHVDEEKRSSSNSTVSRSDHIHDSNSGSESPSTHTIADGTPPAQKSTSSETTDYDTVDPDTTYRRRDIEPEYEHESPGMNPDGSLQTTDGQSSAAADTDGTPAGMPPFARLVLTLVVTVGIAVGVYLLVV